MGRVIKSGRMGASRGVAADELRRHNLGTVLEHLHLAGPSPRSHLTAITGLNRSTVADLIGELTDLGLVVEKPGESLSGPGRPSPVVHVRPDGAVALAVEMSVDSIAVATVGIGGHVYDQIRIARPRGHLDPLVTIRDIGELARPLLAELPDGHRLAAMGVAVVGIVRRRDGFVHLAPNLDWRDLPLGRMLSEELNLQIPISVANDADLGALGEHRRGGLGGVSDLLYISGEVGIGCGVIIDGEPLLGAAGYAGEAGHMFVTRDGRECRCGATGCWETEAGEKSLLRRVAAHTDSGLAAVGEIEELAGAGDGPTLRAIAETGTWLGIGMSNLINLFNPDVIVLGGLYHVLFEYLEESVLEAIDRAIPASRGMAEIRRSSIGPNAPLVGAAELALVDLIDDPAGVAGL